MNALPSSIPGFRTVPKTGVIYVVTEAGKRGFGTDPEWANLGQGAPEIGELDDAPSRITSVEFDEAAQEYAPVAGLPALRQAVADLYNNLYRANKESQYTVGNVAICSGGRLALTRIAASIADVNVGHFLPDYTAYEELLTVFKAFNPIPLLLNAENAYTMSAEQLREEILGMGLGSLLISNPCNPTGQHIRSEQLQNWIEVCKETSCTAIFDEFYSHYTYGDNVPDHGMVSAAEYIDDVDTDPIVIVDGLTKNWRYPGWRICWTVAPKPVIESISSAGSFIDGGAPHPLQRAAVPLLSKENVLRETTAIRSTFKAKRDYVLDRLSKMNISVEFPPQGAFYCWADISRLPEPLNNGMNFFQEGLNYKVITVPGEFFDVNPGQRRRHSRYEQFTRISFGPSMETLERGLNAMERMIGEKG